MAALHELLSAITSACSSRRILRQPLLLLSCERVQSAKSCVLAPVDLSLARSGSSDSLLSPLPCTRAHMSDDRLLIPVSDCLRALSSDVTSFVRLFVRSCRSPRLRLLPRDQLEDVVCVRGSWIADRFRRQQTLVPDDQFVQLARAMKHAHVFQHRVRASRRDRPSV